VFQQKNKKSTFNGNDFNQALGPIAQNTIDLIDTKKFQKINSWGAGQFYMPHGLTVDSEGNVWVTDVGLQQVFKYEFGQFDKPLLTLGERFKTGSDASHFCKPTDVAESENNGHIFVSDGYCNSRVVEFDKTGKFVKQFEDTDKPMFVVHSVTVVDPLNYVCVASREDGRLRLIDRGDKF
jgi:DNA-binding beta-propeller fold protein YncE